MSIVTANRIRIQKPPIINANTLDPFKANANLQRLSGFATVTFLPRSIQG